MKFARAVYLTLWWALYAMLASVSEVQDEGGKG